MGSASTGIENATCQPPGAGRYRLNYQYVARRGRIEVFASSSLDRDSAEAAHDSPSPHGFSLPQTSAISLTPRPQLEQTRFPHPICGAPTVSPFSILH